MKKLLYSLAALFGISVSVLAQAPPGYPNSFYNMWSSNILVSSPTMTNELRPGQMTLRVTPTSVFPLIRFIGTNSVGTIKLYDATPNTLELATDVIVDGNLTALGTVTGSGLVFSLTNFTTVTNAIIATNAPDLYPVVSTNMLAVALADTNLYKLAQSYYPTNSSATNTDMTVAYGDVMWGVGFYWPQINGGSLSTTNYQTAVRILHATNAPAGGTNFGWDNRIRTYGSLRITNETICTFFYNPSSGTTNLFCLPVW